MILYIGLCVGFFLIWYLLQKRMDAVQLKLQDALKALSFDVMDKNGKQFLNLADATLKPLQESMRALEDHQRHLEKARTGAYEALTTQINGLITSEKELRLETMKLSSALRSSQMRGSWGEVHLKRVVELAGLVNHCDFLEQKTYLNDNFRLRPDLIVNLPGQRFIAIDAKTPLSAYLEAMDIEQEERRKEKLLEHANALKKHIKDLASKEYWKQFDNSFEFVVLFLPAESFFSAALQSDPTLIELGAKSNVIVATPTTLIAILRSVAYGWKQEALSKNALENAKIGAELYERMMVFMDHLNKMGRSLNQAVDSYNQSLSSLESRVLVSARKLKESTASTKDLPELDLLEKSAKVLSVD